MDWFIELAAFIALVALGVRMIKLKEMQLKHEGILKKKKKKS